MLYLPAIHIHIFQDCHRKLLSKGQTMKIDILISHKSTLKTVIAHRRQFKKEHRYCFNGIRCKPRLEEMEDGHFNILKTKFTSVLTPHTHKIDADEKGSLEASE